MSQTAPTGSSSGRARVSGYAVVFDSLSEDLGGYRERVMPGAFQDTLKRRPDVRFLTNHQGLPLARVSNGTLALAEDTHGLRFIAELADTQEGRDLLTLIRAGDVSQMSFAFRLDGGDEWSNTAAGLVSTINRVSDLYEISAVGIPAYGETEVSAA